jgi:pimeloyl-ACP methyl ester carboxylesterase
MNAVMVHGAGGGGWEWRLWADVFTVAGAGVFAPDLRPSPRGLAATTFADYRTQVADWLAAAPVPVVAIGASLGGLLVLAAAAEAARPPAALVLVNPVPPYGIEPRPPRRTRPAVVRWSQSDLADTMAALPDADVATARWAHARWRDESGGVLDEALGGIEVARPRCPVLVIASGDDDDIRPVTSRAVAQAFDGDFVTAQGCSHVGVLLGTRAAGAAALALAWCAARGIAAEPAATRGVNS